MKFQTALRPYATKRLEEIGSADILVGIPCFNNQDTITHVVQMVTHGLAKHYGNKRSVILIADGGSTDDTRETAREFEIKPWQEKLITIYRGLPGKGSALRAVFEAADRLGVTACATVDSDLRSITGDWVKYLLEPVLEKGYQYVSPVYTRYKYDGTITNNIVYNLTRALYGKRIRQPIGGDFAFGRELARYYMEQDVWGSDVARFGIDIWMTTNAITQGFKICQANLGVKIHDAKDPAASLGPMFRQVIYTLFALMERYETFWKGVRGSEPVETFEYGLATEPEPIAVNLEAMVEYFKTGHAQFGSLWRDIFCPHAMEAIERAAKLPVDKFELPTESWVEILYDLAATFHSWQSHRARLMDLVVPLYYARVASFVVRSRDMSTVEAEDLVEEQARIFEDRKEYLLEAWNRKAPACDVVLEGGAA